jgi:hypothetical protein
VHRLAGETGTQQWALGSRKPGAVRTEVVHGVVADPAEQLPLVGVPEELQGSRVQ